MNIEALKSNPLFTQGFARQVEIQKAADLGASENVQNGQYTPKATNPANFVQKIKGTNEAAGFISTASKGVEALKNVIQTGNAQDIIDTANKVSFAGKGILEPQAFDTTNGIVTIDLGLGLDNLDLHTANGKDELLNRLNGASQKLKDAKDALSAPINKAEQEQSAKLQNMDMGNSEFLRKLNTVLDRRSQPRGIDALEAKMIEIGNKIF
jgi:hypothetical protein